MSPAAGRLADATLGVRHAAPPEELEVEVDQVLVQRQAGSPVVGDPVEIKQSGARRDLHVLRLPEQFTLVTIGQVLRRAGRVGGQRLTRDERRGRQIRIGVGIDLMPSLKGQISNAAEPNPEGYFRQETLVMLDPSQPPDRYLDYAVQVRTGPVEAARVLASTRVRLELVTLEGFLELVDAAEPARPAGQSRLEFLASVRRLYQDLDLFKVMIQRHAHVPPLAAPSPQTLERQQRLCAFERLYHGADRIDIGHVLVGIEAMPNQDPQPSINVPRVDLALTWSGDLGSAITQYILARFYPPPPVEPPKKDQSHRPCQTAAKRARAPDPSRANWTLDQFTRAYADRADLLGDLDGINLGAVYDPARSLADNLRTYYRGPVAQRYSLFLANTRDSAGNPALPLQPGSNPPRFTTQALDFVARETATFALFFLGTKIKLGLLARNPAAEAVVKVDSPEVRQVARHFLDFLEAGLAAQPLVTPGPTGIRIAHPDGSALAGRSVHLIAPGTPHLSVPATTDAQGRVTIPNPEWGTWRAATTEWELLPASAAAAVPPQEIARNRAAPDPAVHVPVPPGTVVDLVARRTFYLICPQCGLTFKTVERAPGGSRSACPHDGFDLSELEAAVATNPASFTLPTSGQNPAATPTSLRTRGTTSLATTLGPVTVYWDESRFLAPAGGDYRLWARTPTGAQSVDVIGRATWGADPPLTASRPWEFHEAALGASPAYATRWVDRSENRPLRAVLMWMTVHHTTDTGKASFTTPREIQVKHQGPRNNTDIGYHYIIDTNGAVYEGRPLGLEGQHAELFNAGNVGIALAGDFEPRWENRWRPDTPTTAQLQVLDDLVRILAARFDVASVWTHQERKRQAAAGPTECPGARLIPHVTTVLRPAFPGPPP